jgi:Flp pilus assembly protein TadG
MKKKNLFSTSGQTLVEFALIIPLFILIVMFIFDIGRGVYYYSVLYNAVREGARLAVVEDEDNSGAKGIKSQIENLVVERAYGMDLETGDVSVSWSAVNPIIVTVGASYGYEPITPIIGAFLPGGELPMGVEARMRLEFD